MARVGPRTLIAALAGVAAVTAPLWLRSVSFFDIRQVEVVGTRYLDPGELVAALQLGDDRSLFSSLESIETRVSGIAGVGEVEVARRLPATLRIAIVERVPIALVPGADGLIPLDSEARPLPYDPAVAELDLPLVAASDRALTRAMALVRSVDAEMYAAVVMARNRFDGTMVLEFADQDVAFRSPPAVRDILKITAVRRQQGEDSGFDHLDARFDGLVVARRRT